MTDKELLELAARAAEIEIEWKEWVTGRVAEFQTIKYTKHRGFWSNGKVWNPLTDDGDALRLAVKLKFNIHFGYDWGTPVVNVNSYPVTLRDDPYATTRQAIVRAAAEIGRTL